MTFHYCFSCWPAGSNDGCAAATWHQQQSKKPLALIAEPVTPDELEDDEPGPCYGKPHRVVDYSSPERATDCGYYTLMGTKIGGYPPPIQPLAPPADSTGAAMRFLACIGSMRAADITKTTKPTTPCGDLIWLDMGCIYFWGSANKRETSWTLACY